MNLFQLCTDSCNCCGITPPISLFLHTIRSRAANHRFCTNCILKQNNTTFCPICFQLFDDFPHPTFRLMCVRCSSTAHRSCLLPSSNADSAFICPPCSNPNFSYLDFDRVFELPTAKLVVTAAQITAILTSKAATVARLDAERRCMEASVARRKAAEALEQLADMFRTSKKQKDDSALTSSE